MKLFAAVVLAAMTTSGPTTLLAFYRRSNA